MMETLNHGMVNVADWIFGLILFLPRDIALFSVAILSSAFLTLVRRWTTDQEWLRRAVTDEERQNQLQREARRQGDLAAAKRHKDVITRIKMKTLRFEWAPLLWALLPVTLLATWAFARLAYEPPRLHQLVEVRACMPRSAIGQMAHLAPEPGIAVAGDWIQPVVEDRRSPPTSTWDTAGLWLGDRLRGLFHVNRAAAPGLPDGAAVWQVILHDKQPHVLRIRYAGRTYEAAIRAGTPRYEEPSTFFQATPVRSIEVVLNPTRLFNFVGGIDWLFLPPWLVAYLLIAIPLMPILRRVFHVA